MGTASSTRLSMRKANGLPPRARTELRRVWSASTGQSLAVLRGHDGPVTKVAFDPAGRRLLTTGTDQTVRIWALSDGGVDAQMRSQDIGQATLPLDGTAAIAIRFEPTDDRLWILTSGSSLFRLITPAKDKQTTLARAALTRCLTPSQRDILGLPVLAEAQSAAPPCE